MTRKYINVLTGQDIVVYPWSSKKTKDKVSDNSVYMELFEETLHE